ncbi:protein ILRUN [Dermatophagoides pteronyssinus]|uniref:protein ILRUN n=1 Tax=Dermatophagoides pteronyssinus TaxID=6956 RepID=UPI003F67C68C
MDVDLTNNSSSSDSTDPITSELLQKFSCLNTTDHDVLIKQFNLLLGEKCSDSTAEFWLDMNNWNLQAAICSYFDYESTLPQNYLQKLPEIQIKPEPNICECLPNSSFTYRCTVNNSGDEPWPYGCTLRFYGGHQMTHEERFLLPKLQPGQSWTLQMQFTSPDKPGLYESQWRFSAITGQCFGETICMIVHVMDDLNQVTKQLSAAHIVDNIQQSTQQNQVISVSEHKPQDSFVFSGPHQAITFQTPLAQRPNFIHHPHQQTNQENNHENIDHQQQNGLNNNYNHLNNDHQNVISPSTMINNHPQHDGSDNDSAMT